MKQITSIWHRLKGGREDEGKMAVRDKLVLLVLTGILLLVIAWPISGDNNQAKVSEPPTNQALASANATDDYTQAMEQRLTSILENIDGAGKVQVMITLKSTAEQVIEKDESYSESRSTSDASGNGSNVISDSVNRSESTIYSSSSGGNPYVVKEIQPEIEGILVVAEGADNDTTINEITYAVQVLFDVPVHKIKVVKMSSR